MKVKIVPKEEYERHYKDIAKKTIDLFVQAIREQVKKENERKIKE